MIKIPDPHDLVSFANDLCGRRFSPGIDNVSAQNNLNDMLLNSRVIVDIIEKAEYKPMPALLFSVVIKREKNVNCIIHVSEALSAITAFRSLNEQDGCRGTRSTPC